MPELADPLGVGGDRDEMLGHRGLIAQLADQPVPGGGGVGDGLQVEKVLEEMMNSVSSADRSRVASTKSVASTLETNRNVCRGWSSAAAPRTP